jgi:hypothetical protein
MVHKYIVYAKGKLIGEYNSISKAFQALLEVGGGEIYRGDMIVRLEPEEAHELKGIIAAEPIEPPEAPVKPRKKIVVLDQMYKGFFPQVLSKHLPSIEIHVISGRGIDREYRSGSIVYHPAETDFDVGEIVEKLAKEGEVIFFTGDKKLYNHVLMLGVKAYYLPPSESPSKEMLAKKMIELILRNQ